MLLECLIILIVTSWMYQRWRYSDIYEMGRRLNSGVRTLPFFGHSYLFIGNNETQMKAFHTLGRDAIKKENGLSSMWHGLHLYTMVADPVAAEFIMKSALEKDSLMNLAKLYIGNGSIFAPVSIWKPRRKVMIKSFAPKNIKKLLSIITQQSGILIEQLDKVAGTGVFSMWKYFTAYTMDTITEATLGYKLHAQKDSRHPLLDAFSLALQSGSTRICSPWLRSDLVYHNLPIYKKLISGRDYVWQLIRELIIIAKRKETLEEKHDENEHLSERGLSTFLELLMRYSGEETEFTEIEVIEELSTILIAGNDTTAVASCFISVILSRHPEVQQKIWAELRDVFGDSDRSPTNEDLLRLNYLEAVIKETLRLYTPVPVISRQIDKELNLPSGFKIVSGTGVLINIWAIHRNPRYWGDDAEQFRPDRFLDAPLKHPAAFMPFSFGPRNCVGYHFAMTSIKTAISSIIRNFKILPPNNLPCSEQPPIRLQYDLMMKDVDNFQLKLERR